MISNASDLQLQQLSIHSQPHCVHPASPLYQLVVGQIQDTVQFLLGMFQYITLKNTASKK